MASRLLSFGQIVATGDEDGEVSWRGGGADRESDRRRGSSNMGTLEGPEIPSGAEAIDIICSLDEELSAGGDMW